MLRFAQRSLGMQMTRTTASVSTARRAYSEVGESRHAFCDEQTCCPPATNPFAAPPEATRVSGSFFTRRHLLVLHTTALNLHTIHRVLLLHSTCSSHKQTHTTTRLHCAPTHERHTHTHKHEQTVIDHYENPRNVGSLDKEAKNVGTGLVGAPGKHATLSHRTLFPCICSRPLYGSHRRHRTRTHNVLLSLLSSTIDTTHLACGDVMKLQIRIDDDGIVREAKFKTFGCGSAIASSSFATEWIKDKHIDEAVKVKNTTISKHLNLPPVKLHCSMLAEDAIKAAIQDFKGKQTVTV
jgi:nitrogen fixation NifU-like protein